MLACLHNLCASLTQRHWMSSAHSAEVKLETFELELRGLLPRSSTKSSIGQFETGFPELVETGIRVSKSDFMGPNKVIVDKIRLVDIECSILFAASRDYCELTVCQIGSSCLGLGHLHVQALQNYQLHLAISKRSAQFRFEVALAAKNPHHML